MKNLFQDKRYIIAIFVLLYVAINFLVWKQLDSQIKADKEQTLESAIHHNNNLVIALEQNTIRTLQDADAILTLVKFEYERTGRKLKIEDLYKQGLLTTPIFDGLIVMDTNGKAVVTFPANLNKPNLNYADRQYFLSQKGKDNLYISTPVSSRTIKKQVIIVSRRINDQKGRFNGVVAIQLQPASFLNFYNNAVINRYDILSLISPEGITYSRRTGNIESSGEDISASPLFTHLKRSPASNYFAKDAIRGIPTYFSYRKLSNYPIIATVGSRQADVLAQYNNRRRKDIINGIVVSVLLLVFICVVILAFFQRRKAIVQLKKSELKYRSLFESSNEAILLIKPEKSIVSMNKAACELFHHKFEKGSGVKFRDLFQCTEPAIELDLDRSSSDLMKEVKFRRKDNSFFVGEINYTHYSDARENHYVVLFIRDITLRKKMQARLDVEEMRHQRELTKQIIIAQENEREAIGYELHDNVNQILTTAKLYLETALLHKTEDNNYLLQKSKDFIQTCIIEIRNLSHVLSSPTLGTKSLVDSIQSQIDHIAACTRLELDFEHSEYIGKLAKEHSIAIYRIFQEQLNNIVKHSGAKHVSIVLKEDEGGTILEIKDDGKGFDPADKHKGIGLNNISSRVKAFNGDLKIHSEPGKGCLLKIRVPFNEEIEYRIGY